MKTKTTKQNKVQVITLGCSKNVVDSEVLMTQLKANNFDLQNGTGNNDSNIIIINTCGFIENAKKESIDTILLYAKARNAGLIDKLIVTGCLSQRYKPELEKEISGVDHFFGTNQLPHLLKTLKADYKHELIGERVLTTPSHFAYLKISEGCNRGCSFCAIPIMRGKHVSKSIDSIIHETKNLVKNGVKELILIAQDLSSYGIDIYHKKMLPDLLKKLSDVDGIEWIRLHYIYPSQFPLETLKVMKERKNICNYVDIPLQHISDNMLKKMRRGITKARTLELIKNIRNTIPGIAFRTTLMVGFPGETEQDFDELNSFVEQIQFDRLGVFTYSHEENTKAFELKDDVPNELKQHRADIIMHTQQKISFEKNLQKAGKTFKTLFDSIEGDYFVGRTEHDSPEVDNAVLVPKKNNYLRIGDFTNIKINYAKEYDLYGEIANA